MPVMDVCFVELEAFTQEALRVAARLRMAVEVIKTKYNQ